MKKCKKDVKDFLFKKKKKKPHKKPNPQKTTKTTKEKIPFLLFYRFSSLGHPSHDRLLLITDPCWLSFSPTNFSGSLFYSKDEVIQMSIIPEFPLPLGSTPSPWCSIPLQKANHLITLPTNPCSHVAFNMEFEVQQVFSQVETGTSESLTLVRRVCYKKNKKGKKYVTVYSVYN